MRTLREIVEEQTSNRVIITEKLVDDERIEVISPATLGNPDCPNCSHLWGK